MSDRLDRVPATIPGLVQPGVAVYNSRDLLTGRIVEGEAGGLLVWCPTEGDGNVHAFDVGDWDSVDLNDRTSRVHAAWLVHRQHAGKAGTLVGRHDVLSDEEELALWAALHGEDMAPEQIDTLARLVLRLAEEVGDE